jgi:integrase
MLGTKRIGDLTTSDIRNWHRTVASHISSYTANVAKKFLRAALALAAEDFNLRVPLRPSRLGRGRSKAKKTTLKPDQVGRLLQAALRDEPKGNYYAFPFLTGVRPSEQLALLWQDVDLDGDVVHIRRMHQLDGSLCEFTKTAAGARKVPISPLLKSMLFGWRAKCPTNNGTLKRVFPSLGDLQNEHHKKRGDPLSYANFRRTYWRPGFAALGLPYVNAAQFASLIHQHLAG